MGQGPDQLRQEIDQKREDAAQKIDQIQSQVQDAAQTVQDKAMQVKESFDVRRRIEDKPMVALGAALIGGFVLGGLASGNDRGRGQGGYAYDARSGERQQGGSWQGAQSGPMSGIRSAAKSAGLEDTLSHAATALMTTIADRVRDSLDQSFPGFADKLKQAQKSDEPGGQSRSTVGVGTGTSGSLASGSAAATDSSGRTSSYYAAGNSDAVGNQG